MAEHITDMCRRIRQEICDDPVAPLDDVPLSIRMRARIERWYSDRAFLALFAERAYKLAEMQEEE